MTSRGRRSSTAAALELRKMKVAHFLERGWNATRIARELGMSQPAVLVFIRELQADWVEAAEETVSQLKARKLAELRLIKSEAWDAWDLSAGRKQVAPEADDDLEVTVDAPPLLLPGEVPSGEFQVPPTIVIESPVYDSVDDSSDAVDETDPDLQVIEQQIAALRAKAPGDAVYLRIILETVKAERELLGLDAPKKSVELQITPADISRMSTEQLEKLVAQLSKGDRGSLNIDAAIEGERIPRG